MPLLLLLPLIGTLAIALGVLFLGVDIISSEGGPTEMATFVILLLTAFAVVAIAPRTAILRFWHVPLLLLLLAEREHDPGLAWVDLAVLTPSHWAAPPSPGIAVLQTILAIATLWAVVTLLWREPPALLAAIRKRADWRLPLGLAALCVVVSQLAEEIGGGGLMLLIEEGVETIFALWLSLAMILRAKHWRDVEAGR